MSLCRKNKESEQLLVREAECHDKLASIYYDLGMVAEARWPSFPDFDFPCAKNGLYVAILLGA